MATANWNRFDDLDENVSNSNSPNSLLLSQLESITQLMLQDEYRSSIPENVLIKILHIIEKEECSLETVQCFRLLRNSMAHNWQEFPETWMLIFNKSINLHNSCVDNIESNEKFLDLCRISLQFIANVLNSQPICNLNAWMKLKHNFSSLISHKDEKINMFASSIVYSIMRNCTDIKREVIISEHWKLLIIGIIQASHKGIVFSQFLVQLFMQEPNLSEIYKHLEDLEIRLLFLHQMSEFITPDCEMNEQNWSFISQLFQDRARLILRTCDSPIMDLEAVEVSGLVELLAKGSSNDDCRKQLHVSENLAIVAIELLQAMHQLGKSENNYFTTLNDHFASVEEHPALNFKCNLIRLIGNLCYQNANVQDRLRESECILPLLECCNLDARNPFIQQWAILTLRNFCEDNPLNQQLINSLTQQGAVKP